MPTASEYQAAVAASRAGVPATPPVGGQARAAEQSQGPTVLRPGGNLESSDGLFSDMIGVLKEEIGKDIRSIPHLIPALLNPGFDESATPEENELRRRAVGNAAFMLMDFGLGYAAAGLLRGAPTVMKMLGTIGATSASTAVGSTAYAQITTPPGEKADLAGAAMWGAAQGAVFGGAGALWRGMRARAAMKKGGLEKGPVAGEPGAPGEPPLGGADDAARKLASEWPDYQAWRSSAPGAQDVDPQGHIRWGALDPDVVRKARNIAEEDMFEKWLGIETPAGQQLAKAASEPPVSVVPGNPQQGTMTKMQYQRQAQDALALHKISRRELGNKPYEEQLTQIVGRQVSSTTDMTIDEYKKIIGKFGPQPQPKPEPTTVIGQGILSRRRRGGGFNIYPDREHIELHMLSEGKILSSPDRMMAVMEKIGVTTEEELHWAAQVYNDVIKRAEKQAGKGVSIRLDSYQDVLHGYPAMVERGMKELLEESTRATKPPVVSKGAVNKAKQQTKATPAVAPDAPPETPVPPAPGPPPAAGGAPAPPSVPARVAAVREGLTEAELKKRAHERMSKLPHWEVSPGVRGRITPPGTSALEQTSLRDVTKGTPEWFEVASRDIGLLRNMLNTQKNILPPEQRKRAIADLKKLLEVFETEATTHGVWDMFKQPKTRAAVKEQAPGSKKFIQPLEGKKGVGMHKTAVYGGGGVQGRKKAGDIFSFWRYHPKYKIPEFSVIKWQPRKTPEGHAMNFPLDYELRERIKQEARDALTANVRAGGKGVAGGKEAIALAEAQALSKAEMTAKWDAIDQNVAESLWDLYHGKGKVRQIIVSLTQKDEVEALERAARAGLLTPVAGSSNRYNLTAKAGQLAEAPKRDVFKREQKAVTRWATSVLRESQPGVETSRTTGLPISQVPEKITEQGLDIPSTAKGRLKKLQERYEGMMLDNPKFMHGLRLTLQGELGREATEKEVEAAIAKAVKDQTPVLEFMSKNIDEYKRGIDKFTPPLREPAAAPKKGEALQRPPDEVEPPTPVTSKPAPVAPKIRTVGMSETGGVSKEIAGAPREVVKNTPAEEKFVQSLQHVYRDASGQLHANVPIKGNKKDVGFYDPKSGMVLFVEDVEPFAGDLVKAWKTRARPVSELGLSWAAGVNPPSPKKPPEAKAKTEAKSERGTLQLRKWYKELQEARNAHQKAILEKKLDEANKIQKNDIDRLLGNIRRRENLRKQK